MRRGGDRRIRRLPNICGTAAATVSYNNMFLHSRAPKTANKGNYELHMGSAP